MGQGPGRSSTEWLRDKSKGALVSGQVTESSSCWPAQRYTQASGISSKREQDQRHLIPWEFQADFCNVMQRGDSGSQDPIWAALWSPWGCPVGGYLPASEFGCARSWQQLVALAGPLPPCHLRSKGLLPCECQRPKHLSTLYCQPGYALASRELGQSME